MVLEIVEHINKYGVYITNYLSKHRFYNLKNEQTSR